VTVSSPASTNRKLTPITRLLDQPSGSPEVVGAQFVDTTSRSCVADELLGHDGYLGLFDRIGMQDSLFGPQAREGFRSFKHENSPNWVHPELQVDGRQQVRPSRGMRPVPWIGQARTRHRKRVRIAIEE
jgi:hypothetical protein